MEENKKTLQIIMLSGQPIPNLLPLMSPECKPDNVVLIVSPVFREQVSRYELILKPRGIVTETVAISEQDVYSFENIEEIISQVITRYKKQEYSVYLNATGGNKLMSLGAFHAAFQHDASVFYIENQDIYWLLEHDERAKEAVCPVSQLKIRDYFLIHGTEVQQAGDNRVPLAYQHIMNVIGDDIHYFQPALTFLNYLIAQSDGNTVHVPERHPARDALLDLVDIAVAEKLMRTHGNQLHFVSDASQRFFNGVWLELYIYLQIRQLIKSRNLEGEVEHSVEVQRLAGTTPVDNELDVVVLIGHQLHIIECKTTNNRKQSATKTINDAIYKLSEHRHNLGGNRTKVMYLSVQKVRKANKSRAALDNNIDVMALEDTRDLKHEIARWLGL